MRRTHCGLRLRPRLVRNPGPCFAPALAERWHRLVGGGSDSGNRVRPRTPGRTFANLLNTRGDNRGAVLRMAELQVHPAAYEMQLQHRTTPRGTGNGYQHGLGAVLRMSRDQRLILVQQNRGVAMVLGVNLQHSSRGEVAQKDSSLDLRLHYVVVHAIVQVGMRREQGKWFSQGASLA